MNNSVITFLREHHGVIFSPKSVSRHTGMQLKNVVRIAHNNPNIRLARPREVGGGCRNLTLLTIKHAE